MSFEEAVVPSTITRDAEGVIHIERNDLMKFNSARIEHTRLLGGGESETIGFEVRRPGEYPYVYSFPGHVAMMMGVLVVK
jgi:azurin